MMQWYPSETKRMYGPSQFKGRRVLRSTFRSIPIMFLVGVMGCRGPLNPYSRYQTEPSFDRLLELESRDTQQSSQSAQPNQYRLTDERSLGSQTAPDSQVVQRRPGGQAAASRHSEHEIADETPANRKSRQTSPPQSDSMIARRTISDSMGEDEGDGDFLDDPNEEAVLLRQTQTALKNRYQSPSKELHEVAGQSRSPGADLQIANRGDGQGGLRNRYRDDIDAPTPSLQTHDALVRSAEHPNDSLAHSQSARENAAHRGSSANAEGMVQPASHVVTRDNRSQSELDDLKDDVAEKGPVDLRWDQHLEQAMQQLTSSSSSQDVASLSAKERIRQEVVIRLLAMALGDREQMTTAVEGLEPLEQEYFRYQFTALMDAIDPDANPASSRRWSLVMLNQRKAHENLASLSNLEVSNLSFCTEVESFGVTERFSKYQFTPDQEVLLYCELDNFVSEKSKDGKGYETQLHGSYEVVDATGKRVADQSLPIDSHICRNRRRDYFIAYRIYMPHNISAGNYTLRLTIEDLKGQKFGQSEVSFQIQ